MIEPQYFRYILRVRRYPALNRRILFGRTNPVWTKCSHYAPASGLNRQSRDDGERRSPSAITRAITDGAHADAQQTMGGNAGLRDLAGINPSPDIPPGPFPDNRPDFSGGGEFSSFEPRIHDEPSTPTPLEPDSDERGDGRGNAKRFRATLQKKEVQVGPQFATRAIIREGRSAHSGEEEYPTSAMSLVQEEEGDLPDESSRVEGSDDVPSPFLTIKLRVAGQRRDGVRDFPARHVAMDCASAPSPQISDGPITRHCQHFGESPQQKECFYET